MKHAHRLSAVVLPLLLVACGGGDSAPKPTSDPNEPTFADAPPGTTRLELDLSPFDLDPGQEAYKCQNFENPFGRDVAVLQTQSIMSPGSHHLFAFRNKQNVSGDIEDCSGLEFMAALHATQVRVARSLYPEGVGVFHPASQGIRLNSHYFNLTDETVHARVRVVLDYVDADAVPTKASQLLMGDSQLDIPPGTGTAGGALGLPSAITEPVHLLSAESHMHRRGKTFTASLDGGSPMYESGTWDEPPVKDFSPALTIPVGSKIHFQCTYENETAAHLTFGESANTNEMCVFTGFYYPAPGGKTILGDTLAGSLLVE